MTAESPKPSPRRTETTSAQLNDLLGEVGELTECIRVLVDAATPAQLSDPSGLPDWDRARVFAHICGFSHAIARQMEYGAHGKQIRMYDGDTEGRNADIERRSAGDPAELRREVADALDMLSTTINAMDDNDWDRPISYRDTSVLGGLEGAWRELSIHSADLNLGYSPLNWSYALCDHLFDFLGPRVPADITLVLRPEGGSTRRLGDGPQAVDATGRGQDLAAWLAGRATPWPIEFSTGAAPTLSPWPPRKP